MRLADRSLGRIATAPLRMKHWRALAGIFLTFTAPVEALLRYLGKRGTYPWSVRLRTPIGTVEVALESRHDLLTVVEVFCRRDYGSAERCVVVDIGANVGLASLFFLTRSAGTRVWGFEPDEQNVTRLHETLQAFEGRYCITRAAVTVGDMGFVRFTAAGRYGHLSAAAEDGMAVPAVSIARALREIAEKTGSIDLVKIDTEGTEPDLVAAIPADVAIREVRFELPGRVVRLEPYPGWRLRLRRTMP